jgi:hypothetical protein
MIERFLSKDLLEEVKNLESELAWLQPSQQRGKRWQHFFEAQQSMPDAEKKAVDLFSDPVMNHYRVDHAERLRRRYITEHCLDNMVRHAGMGEGSLGVLHETTATSSIATNITWQLPLIRKIWPRLFLWEVTSVQPMNQPQGRMFVLDTQYGTAGGAYASGTSIYDSEDPAYANDPGEGVEPKELNLRITSSSVVAQSKKLKGVWNIEAEQDLQAYHNLALEPEIVKMLGMEIEREINRSCITQLVNAAATNTNWSSTQPATPNPWANATPRQYAESLMDAIEDANKAIKDDVFVDANVLLCGTAFANRMRKLNSFRMIDDPTVLQGNIVTGPNLFGTLNGKYKVFEDPFFTPSDKALLLHKGSNWLYTGSAYCPYVPVWTTPTIHNTKMQPGKGYLTRYAFKIVNSKFYGTVTVS